MLQLFSSTPSEPWWKDAIVYQIYPSSFMDSDGDGMGDIPGIISKLDYLKELGINVIWLSPHFKSPQKDMGYDISDYKDIYEKYGTLADCFKLISECHKRDIKIIFDLVVNHTSDQHEWFKESRSSKTNPKRDWYIWRPAKYDKDGNREPPNNWASVFGGSAWEWDEHTEEYYLHLFVKEQPDINWENHTTRKAIYQDAILFWLKNGVDGFRIDTVSIYSKPKGLPDAPIRDPGSPWQNAHGVVDEGPQLHEIIQEMNQVGFSKYNAMTVGESGASSYEVAERYVSAARKEISMIFQFDMFTLGKDVINWKLDDFGVPDIKAATSKWQKFIDGRDTWTTAFLENHDGGRSVSRFASDSPEHRQNSAKMLAIYLTTLSGTLFIYQGQEIGMINVPKSWPIEEYKDVWSQQVYDILKERHPGDPKAVAQAMEFVQTVGRDNCRTPMQWDETAHGGFSSGEPWMSANPSYSEINVRSQEWDPNSTLSFWKRLIQFRKTFADVTIHGKFDEYDTADKDVFAYTKTSEKHKLLVAVNFTGEEREFTAPASAKVLLSSASLKKENALQPYEGIVYQLHD